LAAIVNYGSIFPFLFFVVKVLCYCKFKDAPTALSATQIVFQSDGSGKTIVAFWRPEYISTSIANNNELVFYI
jgi:hypothetical protein